MKAPLLEHEKASDSMRWVHFVGLFVTKSLIVVVGFVVVLVRVWR
jgi:hypothetical protein